MDEKFARKDYHGGCDDCEKHGNDKFPAGKFIAEIPADNIPIREEYREDDRAEGQMIDRQECKCPD